MGFGGPQNPTINMVRVHVSARVVFMSFFAQESQHLCPVVLFGGDVGLEDVWHILATFFAMDVTSESCWTVAALFTFFQEHNTFGIWCVCGITCRRVLPFTTGVGLLYDEKPQLSQRKTSVASCSDHVTASQYCAEKLSKQKERVWFHVLEATQRTYFELQLHLLPTQDFC